MNDVLAEAFPFDIFECRHCETIVISGPGSGARLRLASCCSSLAVNDGAHWGRAQQLHAIVAEADAFSLERRDDTMQGACLGVGDAAARSLPSRQTRTRDRGALGQLLL